jgi:Cu-Zn family superoxide dismutase
MTRTTRRGFLAATAGSAVVVAHATKGRSALARQGTPATGGDSFETVTYALPGEAVYPEGVAYDPAAGVFYVGSTSTGTIFRGNLESGEVTAFIEASEQGLTGVNGMKVDASGLLWVSGASTGLAAVYDTVDGAPVGQVSNGLGPDATFINDVAVSGEGVGYFTDSLTPQLWAIPVADGALGEPEAISFEGTAYTYGEGFNANGIVVTPDDSDVIIVDIGSASLYRYEIASGEVSQVDIGDADLTGGDGLALDGDVLYVCQNAVGQISRLRLSEDRSSATLIDTFTDPAFAFPTTIALTDRGTVLVCNSQFDRQPTSDPVLPFSVVEVAVPPLPDGTGTPAATPGATPTA